MPAPAAQFQAAGAQAAWAQLLLGWAHTNTTAAWASVNSAIFGGGSLAGGCVVYQLKFRLISHKPES